jgi:acyl-CoA synthetase (NDP forming)
MSYTLEQMQAIFLPRTVAVVGAPRSFKPGLVFLQALLDPGFKGEVFPINPSANEILGLKAYPTVSAVPKEVDLAIVLVGIEQLQEVIEDCARKKVRAAIVFTSGFRETGDPNGAERELEMLKAARGGHVRLVGPNCMGVYCPESGLAFFPSMPSTTGPLSFVSQSGSLGSFVSLMGALRGMSFSKVISIGNESDLGSSDFIDYLGGDEKTSIITAYLEGTRDGRGLLRALRKASLRKPVIIWKAGLTSAGAKAVASHTGSLAGSGAVWDSALRQTGTIRAQSVEEMMDIATAFYYMPNATGRRVAIVSGPDGPAVTAAKLLELHGLSAPQLSEPSLEKLRKIIPHYRASLQSSIDLGTAAWGKPSIYFDVLRAVDADPNVDATLLIGGEVTADGQHEYVEQMISHKEHIKKPCMVISIAALTGNIAFAQKLQGANYPLYTTPERAVCAYSKVVKYFEWRKAR